MKLYVRPVSITRFPSFRTQPLENLSVDSVKNGFLSNPAPGENLESENLVMETGCRRINVDRSIDRSIDAGVRQNIPHLV